MTTLLIVVFAFFGLLMLLGWAVNTNMARNQAKQDAAVAELKERFGEGDYYYSLSGPRCIGIAWGRDQLILGSDVASATALPLSDVRSADIEIDGVEVTTSRSTTSTNRGSQLAGGLVGGVLLGPAGALVGGLTGGSTTTGKAVGQRKIKSVKLVIRVADRVAPLRTHVFFDHPHGEGYEAIHPMLQPELEKAAHYHALLTGVIEDRVSGSAATSAAPIQSGSAA
ncbi:hypothetical protein [Sphingomonas sp. Mn802worker]|uniref:hypothetical protein n=1 Tax=Sphingomonas sp. Mn802worker TaxID=629773 RepID=UPI000370E394|nr:hypothetical protein [Sphingomonas sp. Mn802worker]